MGAGMSRTARVLAIGWIVTSVGAPAAFAQDVSLCLVTKTDTNPFFVKMKEGARAKALELGAKLTALAGREEGDNEGQIAAMESCIANGVQRHSARADGQRGDRRHGRGSARDDGILVIALDTPLDPIDSADATFATDNFKAGELDRRLGQGAARRRRRPTPRSPTSTCCRASRPWTCCATRASCRASASTLGDPKQIGDETDPRNVCHDVTTAIPRAAARRWRTACRRTRDINVVYTINEPAAAGGYEALKAVGQGRRTCSSSRSTAVAPACRTSQRA